MAEEIDSWADIESAVQAGNIPSLERVTLKALTDALFRQAVSGPPAGRIDAVCKLIMYKRQFKAGKTRKDPLGLSAQASEALAEVRRGKR